jgi:hypothetical protein
VSSNAQPGQLFQIEKQPPAQFSAVHRRVHDPVAAERGAKLGGRERRPGRIATE